MDPATLSDAKRRLAEQLKLRAPCTPGELAAELGLTEVAVRQHLAALEAAGLARAEKRAASGRGRPALEWSLTEHAAGLFPDRHGELTVDLLGALGEAFGPSGLERLVAARTKQQSAQYRALMPGGRASLRKRVEALAAQRSREGYMAEVRSEKRGEYLLIEHHCPICDAARSCLQLCSSELDVFRAALGDDAEVERVQHVLDGDARCVYRVRKR